MESTNRMGTPKSQHGRSQHGRGVPSPCEPQLPRTSCDMTTSSARKGATAATPTGSVRPSVRPTVGWYLYNLEQISKWSRTSISFHTDMRHSTNHLRMSASFASYTDMTICFSEHLPLQQSYPIHPRFPGNLLANGWLGWKRGGGAVHPMHSWPRGYQCKLKIGSCLNLISQQTFSIPLLSSSHMRRQSVERLTEF